MQLAVAAAYIAEMGRVLRDAYRTAPDCEHCLQGWLSFLQGYSMGCSVASDPLDEKAEIPIALWLLAIKAGTYPHPDDAEVKADAEAYLNSRGQADGLS